MALVLSSAPPATGKPRLRVLAIGLLILFGLIQMGSGLYIHVKASLAQVLLDRAWARTEADGEVHRAWSWADTWPIARLVFPDHGVDLIILEGASGEAMAFGPGRMAGYSHISGPGTAVIAAHRDTHFRFLEDVNTGDAFWVETADGRRSEFVVADITIIDSRHVTVANDPSQSSLVLVTCYPFDVLAVGGPLRYLVFAEPRQVT